MSSKRTFNNDLSALNDFGKAVKHMQPALLSDLRLPITPAMKALILSVINCPYTDPLKRVVLESKVVELLAMQLDQLFQHKPAAQRYVRAEDIEKLHYVKELVVKHMQSPCSLIELAEMSGLNDFKLKRGFKELFGTTVFGYLFDLRMEKAKAMILENNSSIADISYMVGYKNPQHFTAAFKRKFGYLPSEIKGEG